MAAAAAKVMELPWCQSMVPKELETWYHKNIADGTTDFGKDCRSAINKVVKSVQNICSTNRLQFTLSRVVKGGSLGKGTMLKDFSDVDLVAFIKPPRLRSFLDLGPAPAVYIQQLDGIIRELEAALKQLPFVEGINRNVFMINFTINNLGPGGRSLGVDLLPTANCGCGHGRAHADIFRAMLALPSSYDRKFFSASLVEHQLRFMEQIPGHVKALIRLVKYWAYKCLPDKLHKSYPLELITIYRWKNAGEPQRISKAQGLKDVLQVLSNLRGLRHYWTFLYDAALAIQAITQLGCVNPIVLDPANPTKNVCEVYKEGNNIKTIEDAAHDTLKSNLLKDVVVSANWTICRPTPTPGKATKNKKNKKK
ncbi:2'-5'-oligoadenylate synthase 1A-like [Patiria miniata]|uniref:Uncharacterized protein n=1 Tax=Patiria miniata TaxID=46514 RepID=A0A914BJG6_PATMI|nr:2'-5'-oligoadenylate synthase 1A-like [Patiria miniata]